jgi:hypothetical protein
MDGAPARTMTKLGRCRWVSASGRWYNMKFHVIVRQPNIWRLPGGRRLDASRPSRLIMAHMIVTERSGRQPPHPAVDRVRKDDQRGTRDHCVAPGGQGQRRRAALGSPGVAPQAGAPREGPGWPLSPPGQDPGGRAGRVRAGSTDEMGPPSTRDANRLRTAASADRPSAGRASGSSTHPESAP